jgi:FkbM family methyltransferase
MRTIQTPHGVFQTFDHDAVGNALASGQFWDEQIRAALDSADPSGWAIDLGANIGWFSVYLARRHLQVLAIEAHPTTYVLLYANVMANGMKDRVLVVNGAASFETTSLRLAPAAWHGWPDGMASERNLDLVPTAASLAFVPIDAVPTPVTLDTLVVPAFQVDDILMRMIPWPRVTLIKVDCQGADLPALIGLKHTIARDRPLIVFEYEGGAAQWQGPGNTWQDYLDFFEARDYAVERIREDLFDYVARPQ